MMENYRKYPYRFVHHMLMDDRQEQNELEDIREVLTRELLHHREEKDEFDGKNQVLNDFIR